MDKESKEAKVDDKMNQELARLVYEYGNISLREEEIYKLADGCRLQRKEIREKIADLLKPKEEEPVTKEEK